MSIFKKKQTHREQTSGYQQGGEVEGTHYWCKDRLQDILYNTGHIDNILLQL